MKLTKDDLRLIEGSASADSIRRKGRNISLNDEQFEKFQAYCHENKLAANKVLDALIKLFLEANE